MSLLCVKMCFSCLIECRIPCTISKKSTTFRGNAVQWFLERPRHVGTKLAAGVLAIAAPIHAQAFAHAELGPGVPKYMPGDFWIGEIMQLDRRFCNETW